MSQWPASLPTKWLAPAFLIALVQCFFAPTSAEASCGDYVMLGSHGGRHSAARTSATGASRPAGEFAADEFAADEFERGRFHGDRSHGGRSDSSPLSAPRFPCPGPHCSGESPRPLGAPAAPVTPVVRHWGMLELPAAPPLLESRVARFENDAVSVR